ncbi:hypothetical protein, partial [Psychrobacillus psychrotolerans]|uniref:hypothetical protein n=1 Tax=Psychrobacillus psychrotolerans TaxID=126156 RepID=UPI003314CF30
LASNLSEKEKQAKLKEIEALYEEKIIKGLIPYIDAYNYAKKYLEPLLKEIQEAEAKNDFLAVEKAYHKLSVQLKSRTSILYRFSGKAPRDLLLAKYKKPADNKRDEMMVPVTIIMKLTNALQLCQAGKIEEVKKAKEDISSLVAKLSSTNPFHLALIKELEKLQAISCSVPSVASSVILAPGSHGKAGNKKVTGLIVTAKYVVTKGTNFYGVLANGTLSAEQTTKGTAETLAVALTSTEIIGLTNGTSYKVEEVIPPPAGPTKVIVETGSVPGATAGDKTITGLTTATKYVVTEGTNFYGVLANGTLSAVQTTKGVAETLAVALTGTEIIGLTNGTTYKVEEVIPHFVAYTDTSTDNFGRWEAKKNLDLRFSSNAIGVIAGSVVSTTGTGLKSNIKVSISRPGMTVGDIGYFNFGMLLVRSVNEGVQNGDTITLNLNQFQDSNGTELLGTLVMTYNDTLTQWDATITP